MKRLPEGVRRVTKEEFLAFIQLSTEEPASEKNTTTRCWQEVGKKRTSKRSIRW